MAGKESDDMNLPTWYVRDLVIRALAEDVGRGDMTTEATIEPDRSAQAVLLAKQPAVIAGLPVVKAVFHEVDPSLKLTFLVTDGANVQPGEPLMQIKGRAASILTAERVALNFVQRLSGISTATKAAVDATVGTKATIVDTRKTTPGLRTLEKYAVRIGGGKNHRYGLDDAVMIKDNHIAVAGSIAAAVSKARDRIGHMHKIEVEATDLTQVQEALDAGADVILLDNMDLETMKKAVELVAGRAIVEASGGIRPENVAEVAQTGVDVISLGWLTHSAPAVDISLVITMTADSPIKSSHQIAR